MFLRDFFSLLYPEVCGCCGKVLNSSEKIICLHCDFQLPRILPEESSHTIEKLFWGKCELENVQAYLYYNKGGRVQKLMHNFKYRNRPEIGQKLGSDFSQHLKFRDSQPDVVIPVPLHPKKLRIRGFNQSAAIGHGIATSLNIPMEENFLVRTRENETQTKKGRFQRWQNSEGLFKVNQGLVKKYTHVLLVDDVITTGATLEQCVNALRHNNNLKVSIASLAYTTL